jgi:hypothetical protein
MTLVVEKDEPFDPVNIGFLGSRTLMARADRLSDLIEELWLRRRCRRIDRGAALDRNSLQWVYFSAFHVVSSRSGRRSGFEIQLDTGLPYTEVNCSSQRRGP